MKNRIAVMALLTCAPMLASADVVELSPDLYLVVRTSKFSNGADMKIAAINEANQFAASSGRVAVPVSGQLVQLGSLLKEFDYQFRLMTRAEALAAKPTLADVVVAVDGANACGVRVAPTAAALLPELSKLAVLRDRRLLAGNEPKKDKEEDAPAPAATPSAQ